MRKITLERERDEWKRFERRNKIAIGFLGVLLIILILVIFIFFGM